MMRETYFLLQGVIALSNKLDASDGSAFRNLIGPAMLE